MLLTLNAEVKVGLVLIVIAVIGLIFWFASRGKVEYELTEEGMCELAEYRTYMINQWISLLGFWFDTKVEESQTKLVMPGINQNALFFFHENIEIYAIFDWEKCGMEVKTSVYKEDGGYIRHVKYFSIANGSFETDKLYDFIKRARIEHYGEYELSPEDVTAVTKQLKELSKGISPDDARYNFYDHMADLMILMRKKNYRKDKKLLQTYFGLVYYLWAAHKDEFLKFLELPEETIDQDTKENNENIAGNE